MLFVSHANLKFLCESFNYAKLSTCTLIVCKLRGKHGIRFVYEAVSILCRNWCNQMLNNIAVNRPQCVRCRSKRILKGFKYKLIATPHIW